MKKYITIFVFAGSILNIVAAIFGVLSNSNNISILLSGLFGGFLMGDLIGGYLSESDKDNMEKKQ